MRKRHPYPEKRPAKLPGNLWKNNGYWYWRVRLPNAEKRRDFPLKPPGGKITLSASLPREMAEAAAWHLWDNAQAGAMPAPSQRQRTLRILADEYYTELRRYYTPRGEGRPTSTAGAYERAIEELLTGIESERPGIVTGAVISALVERWIGRGLSRSTINKSLGGIAKFFSWLLSQGYIDAYTEAGVGRFPRLAEGRSDAAEHDPVDPADMEAVRATLPLLTPTMRDMVRVQFICDMRPGEMCRISASQIDMTDDELWFYEPEKHKGKHRRKLRIIAVFPEAIEILRPYIARRKPHQPLFSAAESYRESLAAKHAARKTPKNEGNMPCANPIIRAGDQYQPSAYGHRIREISTELAASKWEEDGHPPRPKMPRGNAKNYSTRAKEIDAWERRHADAFSLYLKKWRWTPYQLRHTAATENRALAGREIAALLLGHAPGSSVTDVYTRTVIRDEAKEKAKRELREAARVLAEKRNAASGGD